MVAELPVFVFILVEPDEEDMMRVEESVIYVRFRYKISGRT